MSEMKLGKLPDRTPVKYTIMLQPTLNKRLQAYTAMYNEAHEDGEPEELEALLPYMLEAFLDSDRAFLRRLKQERHKGDTASAPARSTPTVPRQRGNGGASSSAS